MGGPAGASLRELFSPSSVAVIGASRREGSVGHTLFHNILSAEFTGVVYPVNRHWKSVGGVRCYPSVRELPERPDLAVVIVPAPDVARTVKELSDLGTKAAIIVSAGFRETGGEGALREAEVVRIARRTGMKLVGPNCFGAINTEPSVRLNATFSDVMPPTGNIAFISQSGALGHGILRYARSQGIGFTKFVSVGNRAGVNETDLLEAFGEDSATKVILLYLESLAEGRKFVEVSARVAQKKPVLIVKSGRTPLGEEAVRSHTGNLAHAHSDRLFDAVFDEAGVIRAGSIGELFQMAKVFTSSPLPSGPALAILTNSGGPGILAADAAFRASLTLPDLPRKLKARLASQLPPNSSIRNPLDLTAEAKPKSYASALRALLSEPSLDSVLLIATPTGETTGMAVARSVVETTRGHVKPVVTCLFGVRDMAEEVGLLESHGIPNFTFPEEAAFALAQLSRYSSIRARSSERPPIFPVDREGARRALEAARRKGLKALPESLVGDLLRAYGFRVPSSRVVRSEVEALAEVEQIGYPVVLKAISKDILHKSDVGGVALHIDGKDALIAAMVRMRRRLATTAPGATLEGFKIESEITGGSEFILGVKRDPDFGPVILFGLGGVFVEALEDVNFRSAPLNSGSVGRLIASVRGSRLLKGIRGEPPRDVAALEEAILRLSQLAMEQDLVKELDINPLMVLEKGKGAIAVDCRVILG